MGKAGASRRGGCRTVDQGRGTPVESMASCRKMVIEILNYSGFIFSAVGSWAEVFLFSMDFSVPELLGLCCRKHIFD